jgi:hypothetical protein
MKFAITITAIIGLTSVILAQQPYAGLQNRSIKSLSDQQIADLNAGRGMGLALAAELNGYPDPRHAIELANQLNLSPEQITKLKAIALGVSTISQERKLNDEFANRTITLTKLVEATQEIGATQAAVSQIYGD